MSPDSVDPTTEELRIVQRKRERTLREHVDKAPEDEDTGQLEARAEVPARGSPSSAARVEHRGPEIANA